MLQGCCRGVAGCCRGLKGVARLCRMLQGVCAVEFRDGNCVTRACCGVLQCVALYCSVLRVLQCDVTCCSVFVQSNSVCWQYVAGCCSVLPGVAGCFSVLHEISQGKCLMHV